MEGVPTPVMGGIAAGMVMNLQRQAMLKRKQGSCRQTVTCLGCWCGEGGKREVFVR